MKTKRIAAVCTALLFVGQTAFAWGSLGHATVAEVAQRHLSPKAAKAIDKYLNGMKLASIASDADKYRPYWVVDLGFVPTNPDFARVPFLKDQSLPLNFAPWSHSITVDKDMRPYLTDNLDGAYINNDCYYVKMLSEKLKNEAETMDPSERMKAIALIVHFLGDMHCPVHIVYTHADMAKGHFEVTYKGRKMKYHAFWDDTIFSGLPYGFQELAYLVDNKSRREMKTICEGDVYDWGSDSAVKSWEAYERVHPGKDIIPDTFPFDVRPLLYSQLRNAGYRLAELLNEIFG